MEVTDELRALIKKGREDLKYTLAKLSKESKVAISTLSSIESGTLRNIKESTFKNIAEKLRIEYEGNTSPMNCIRVGLGYSLWCSPVLNTLIEDDQHSGILNFLNLKFSCFLDEFSKPQFIDKYVEKPITNSKVYTANELLDSLDNSELDIVFLPKDD